jgi:hypothetical protein
MKSMIFWVTILCSLEIAYVSEEHTASISGSKKKKKDDQLDAFFCFPAWLTLKLPHYNTFTPLS